MHYTFNLNKMLKKLADVIGEFKNKCKFKKKVFTYKRNKKPLKIKKKCFFFKV